MTVLAVILQWAQSGKLSLEQEGITALAGALSTLLVYAVSNHRRLFGA